MEERRKGLDPGEFLVRLGCLRTILVVIVGALALFGAFSLSK